MAPKAKRLGNVVAICLLSLPSAFVWAGSHSAQSAAVTVDTRDSSDAPTIQSVSGKFFAPNRQAFFLSGFPVQEDIRALVDWKGQPAGTIEFRRGTTLLQASSADTLNYNVGGMSMGQTLSVQAVSSDGQKRSSVVMANFAMVPTPPFLQNLGVVGSLFNVIERGDVVEYGIRVGNQWDFWTEDMASAPQDDKGEDIPGCTGNPMKWDITITVSGSVSSDGAYSVSISYKNPSVGWNIVGHKLAPTISGGIHGSYGGTDWSLGGHGAISLDGRHSSPPVYLWKLPPIYAKAYFAYSVGLNGEFTWHSTDGLQWDITLPAEFVVGLLSALGIDGFAAIEVFGGGGPYIKLRFIPLELYEYGIKFEAGIRLIFLTFTRPFSIDSYVDLKGYVEGQAMTLADLDDTAPAVLRALHRPAESGFRLMSRDYLGRSVSPMTLARSEPVTLGSGGAVEVLQADGYPYSQPSLVIADGVPTVFWIRDNPGRTAENRTELVWQQKTGGAWSVPTAVWDDSTADFVPAAASGGDTLAVAWQNTGSVLPEGASLEDAFAAQEIAVAVFDGEGGWTTTNLTQNGWLDHSPKLDVADDGTALLAWVSNPSNSPAGSAAEPNTILYSAWDGAAWSAPAAVANDVGMLLWLSLAWNGTEGVLVCARDMDDDQGTGSDQELWAAVYSDGAWGAFERLTDDDARDANPRVSFGAGGMLLTWFRDGVLMTATDLSLAGATAAGTVGDDSAAADYRTLRGPNGEISLVWQGLDDDQNHNPMMLNYDLTLGRWSQPVPLLDNTNRLERSFSGAFDADGALHLAYNSVEIGADANGLPTLGAVELHALSHTFGVDLAIPDGGLTVPHHNPRPGGTVEVNVEIANLGELAVTNVLMALFDGNPGAGGTLIGETNLVAETLAAGVQTNWVGAWALPEGTDERILYAVVDPGMETADRNRANNSRSLVVLGQDLRIDGTTVVNVNATNRIVTARVESVGGLPVTNAVAVAFRRGTSSGSLLGTATIHPEIQGVTYDASLVWDMTGAVFTSAYENVWIVVDENEAVADVDRSNNAMLTTVMSSLDSDGDGLLDGEELLLGTDPFSIDTDGDGLLDGYDVTVDADDPRYQAWAAAGIVYVDHDGLRTFKGELTVGTDPLNPDTDGDGMSDGDEVRAGTDPLSATDIFKIVAADGEEGYVFAVTWNAKAGRTYRIQTTDDLRGEWTPAPDGTEPEERNERTAAEDGVLRYLDPTPGPVGNRFYRVKVLP